MDAKGKIVIPQAGLWTSKDNPLDADNSVAYQNWDSFSEDGQGGANQPAIEERQTVTRPPVTSRRPDMGPGPERFDHYDPDPSDSFGTDPRSSYRPDPRLSYSRGAPPERYDESLSTDPSHSYVTEPRRSVDPRLRRQSLAGQRRVAPERFDQSDTYEDSLGRTGPRATNDGRRGYIDPRRSLDPRATGESFVSYDTRGQQSFYETNTSSRQDPRMSYDPRFDSEATQERSASMDQRASYGDPRLADEDPKRMALPESFESSGSVAYPLATKRKAMLEQPYQPPFGKRREAIGPPDSGSDEDDEGGEGEDSYNSILDRSRVETPSMIRGGKKEFTNSPIHMEKAIARPVDITDSKKPERTERSRPRNDILESSLERKRNAASKMWGPLSQQAVGEQGKDGDEKTGGDDDEEMDSLLDSRMEASFGDRDASLADTRASLQARNVARQLASEGYERDDQAKLDVMDASYDSRLDGSDSHYEAEAQPDEQQFDPRSGHNRRDSRASYDPRDPRASYTYGQQEESYDSRLEGGVSYDSRDPRAGIDPRYSYDSRYDQEESYDLRQSYDPRNPRASYDPRDRSGWRDSPLMQTQMTADSLMSQVRGKVQASYDPRDPRASYDPRDPRASYDPRYSYEQQQPAYEDSYDSRLDVGASYDPRDQRASIDPRDPRYSYDSRYEQEESYDPRDPRASYDPRERYDPRASYDPRDVRASYDPRDPRASYDSRYSQGQQQQGAAYDESYDSRYDSDPRQTRDIEKSQLMSQQSQAPRQTRGDSRSDLNLPRKVEAQRPAQPDGIGMERPDSARREGTADDANRSSFDSLPLPGLDESVDADDTGGLKLKQQQQQQQASTTSSGGMDVDGVLEADGRRDNPLMQTQMTADSLMSQVRGEVQASYDPRDPRASYDPRDPRASYDPRYSYEQQQPAYEDSYDSRLDVGASYDPRDQRASIDPRDPRYSYDSRYEQEESYDPRDPRASYDPRERYDPRANYDPRDVRASYDPRDPRVDPRYSYEQQQAPYDESYDSRLDVGASNDPRDHRAGIDPRDPRYSYDSRYDQVESYDPRASYDPRDPRARIDPRDPRYSYDSRYERGESQASYDPRDPRAGYDPRYSYEQQDVGYEESYDSRLEVGASYDPRYLTETRKSYDPRYSYESRQDEGLGDPRYSYDSRYDDGESYDPREIYDARDPRASFEPRYSYTSRQGEGPGDPRYSYDSRYDQGGSYDPRESYDPRDPRASFDPRDSRMEYLDDGAMGASYDSRVDENRATDPRATHYEDSGQGFGPMDDSYDSAMEEAFGPPKSQGMRDPRASFDPRDTRYSYDSRYDQEASYDPRDPGASYDPRDPRINHDPRDPGYSYDSRYDQEASYDPRDPRASYDPRDPRHSDDPRQSYDPRDTRASYDSRMEVGASYDPRYLAETQASFDPRYSYDPRDPRASYDPRYSQEQQQQGAAYEESYDSRYDFDPRRTREMTRTQLMSQQGPAPRETLDDSMLESVRRRELRRRGMQADVDGSMSDSMLIDSPPGRAARRRWQQQASTSSSSGMDADSLLDTTGRGLSKPPPRRTRDSRPTVQYAAELAQGMRQIRPEEDNGPGSNGRDGGASYVQRDPRASYDPRYSFDSRYDQAASYDPRDPRQSYEPRDTKASYDSRMEVGASYDPRYLAETQASFDPRYSYDPRDPRASYDPRYSQEQQQQGAAYEESYDSRYDFDPRQTREMTRTQLMSQQGPAPRETLDDSMLESVRRRELRRRGMQADVDGSMSDSMLIDSPPRGRRAFDPLARQRLNTSYRGQTDGLSGISFDASKEDFLSRESLQRPRSHQPQLRHGEMFGDPSAEEARRLRPSSRSRPQEHAQTDIWEKRRMQSHQSSRASMSGSAFMSDDISPRLFQKHVKEGARGRGSSPEGALDTQADPWVPRAAAPGRNPLLSQSQSYDQSVSINATSLSLADAEGSQPLRGPPFHGVPSRGQPRPHQVRHQSSHYPHQPSHQQESASNLSLIPPNTLQNVSGSYSYSPGARPEGSGADHKSGVDKQRDVQQYTGHGGVERGVNIAGLRAPLSVSRQSFAQSSMSYSDSYPIARSSLGRLGQSYGTATAGRHVQPEGRRSAGDRSSKRGRTEYDTGVHGQTVPGRGVPAMEEDSVSESYRRRRDKALERQRQKRLQFLNSVPFGRDMDPTFAVNSLIGKIDQLTLGDFTEYKPESGLGIIEKLEADLEAEKENLRGNVDRVRPTKPRHLVQMNWLPKWGRPMQAWAEKEIIGAGDAVDVSCGNHEEFRSIGGGDVKLCDCLSLKKMKSIVQKDSSALHHFRTKQEWAKVVEMYRAEGVFPVAARAAWPAA